MNKQADELTLRVEAADIRGWSEVRVTGGDAAAF